MEEDKYSFVNEWRTSRIREITKGELNWTQVDLLNISDLATATALRNGLEVLGIKVNYYPLGLATHIKKVLGSNAIATAPYLIITAHGAEQEGDISIGGKLADEIAATQDFNGTMRPEDLKKFIDVSGKVVINTACGGGEKRLVEVFINQGKAKAYLADTLAPFSYVSFLFPLLIFYFLTQYPDLTLDQAFERAKAADLKEFNTWQLFRE